MPRNKAFASPGRPTPFSSDANLEIDDRTINGPLSFFNPTDVRFRVKKSAQKDWKPTAEEAVPGADIFIPGTQIRWRSRDNRKGRHALLIDRKEQKGGADYTATLRAVLRGLRRMATECPYWDVSYLVAVSFTVGCLLFIACGLFYWLPLVDSRYKFPGESTIVGGVLAFVGATLFQIGAVLLVFEACNEDKAGCFGWALHQALHEMESNEHGIPHGGMVLAREDPVGCHHHHQRRRGEKSSANGSSSKMRWRWWPSWYEFKTHYVCEIGFVASASLSLGATIFYVSGICALPGIYENMSVGVARGVYWLTYLVGGILFIFSSALYMLETQPNWYTPAPRVLGWHIGFWNMIGSVGWTLSASFGYCTASWCEYQGELTLLWASVAFFIGSALLWYEALEKYPVENPGKKS